MSDLASPISVQWGDRTLTVQSHPDPPRVEGRHAFVATALYVVRPGLDPILDHENLYAVVRPFCWWCKAFRDDGTPCPGRSG